MSSNTNNNINNTSSKPIKKMILWTRINNSKSTSPHLKESSNAQKKKAPKTSKSGKKEKEFLNISKNDKKILSPSIKTKDNSNLSIKKNNINYTRITITNKLGNFQGGRSFQSNLNEEDKSNYNDLSNKKIEKESQYINNIKNKKNININYSSNYNNTNNINSSEFHINNTYKYFQSTNDANSNKKVNRANCITDNNIFLNKSKNSISKKKISIDKDYKKLNNSKKKISPNNNHNQQISPNSNKLRNSININNNLNSLNNNANINYTIFNQCKRNVNSIPSAQQIKKNTYNEVLNDSNSDRNKKIEINQNYKHKSTDSLEKIKNLELENKKLKKENSNLIQSNKELKILVNKLENEILEIKSVIKENLNQFLQPQNDLVNKTYRQIMDQIEKQKETLAKILNYKKSNVTIEETEKTKDESINNQKTILNDERNNYRLFKKHFFEFFNHVNTSNLNVNGYSGDNDPLKNILNSFCLFMDNIMNKLEDKFINNDKRQNKNKDNDNSENSIINSNYINNFAEISLINLYYEYMIIQLFIVSFFERQHCYYCYSIIDYILMSPFMIIKNNNYIKDFTKKINNIIEIYKKINEEYINRFTEQNIFYLDNYIKLFNIFINNKINLGNNIKIDNEVYEKNTNILFNNDKKMQNVYLDMINNLLEKIKKNGEGNQSLEKFFENRNKGKNKINMIKLTGDNLERISNISNCSSRIIDNYSEKPSFYGFLRNDECPPDMSFGDDDI